MDTTVANESAIRQEAGDGASTAAVRRILFLRGCTILAFIVHALLITRPDASFFSRPFQEDSFYSLSVARSLAEGNGITVDGVHPTNGVQPLICFLDAPLFALAPGDLPTALRLVLALQVVIFIGATIAVAWFATTLLRGKAARREVFWLVAAVVAGSYMLSNGMMNGLETGLSAGLVFAAVAFYNERIAAVAGRVPMGRFVMLGVLLGIGVLSRIDIAFLVVALLLWHLWRAHLQGRMLQGAERRSALVRTLAECTVTGGLAVLVSLPWWAYNYATFGSLVPISGQAQQMLIMDTWANVTSMTRAVSDSFLVLANVPIVISRHFEAIGLVLAVAAFAALLAVTRSWEYARSIARRWTAHWRFSGTVPLLLFSAALGVYYVFFFGAPHFIVRYMVPLRILIIVLLVTYLYLFWHGAKPGSPRRRGLGALVVIAAAGSAYGMTWNFTDHYANMYTGPARWIESNVRPDQQVAMFQTGTTGFLHRNVVNLDGKVNAAALHALQTRTLPNYIEAMRFDYLIDWPEYVTPVLADPVLQGRYRPIDTLRDRFVVWKRVQ